MSNQPPNNSQNNQQPFTSANNAPGLSAKQQAANYNNQQIQPQYPYPPVSPPVNSAQGSGQQFAPVQSQPNISQYQPQYNQQAQAYTGQPQQAYINQPYYNQQVGYPAPVQTGFPQSATQQMASLKEVVDQELERIVPKEFSRWFGSIQYRPRKMKFATQNVGEKVYILVRMHWIRNLGWILNNIFYSFIPFIALFILQLLKINIDFLSLRIFVIILLAYYSIIFSNVIKNFYDWYFDVYIVTNERIVDYVFDPFKGYHVTEAPLESIEDVEEKSLGFLADIFNYGSVKARTASNAGELSFDYIADPTRVRDIIMDLAKIIKSYKNHE